MSVIVNFCGRLGRNAEVKTTTNGKPFVSFTVATDVFVNGNNETMWLNVSSFNDRDLKLAQYLTKGKLVNICGEYSDRIFTNKNNEQQIARDVRPLRIDFVSVGQSGGTETQVDGDFTKEKIQPTTSPIPPSTPFPSSTPSMPKPNTSQIIDDDLPF